MTAVEKVLTEVYDTLLQLRYPGIAQVTSNNIEQTVLGSENRLYLLSWLLSQSPDVPADEFSDNNNEEKLVKWYTNMGICINADALLGKVPIQEQVSTLQNLLLFMKNVLVVDESAPDELLPTLDIFKKHVGKTINIVPPTCSLSSKLNYSEAVHYLKDQNRSLNEKRNCAEESQIVAEQNEPSTEAFGSPQKNNSVSNPEVDKDKAVEKFIEAFESASTWPSLNKTSTTLSADSMNVHIETIHSNMTIFKETLRAKEEVSKYIIEDHLKKYDMPLDKIIEDIVILIEEFRNSKNQE